MVVVDSLGLIVTQDLMFPTNLGFEVAFEALAASSGSNTLVFIFGNILAIRSSIDNVVLSAVTVVVVIVVVDVVVASVCVVVVKVAASVVEMVVGTCEGEEVTGLDVTSSVRNS